MSPLKSVCVFCGSASGADPIHREAARDFGEALALRGMELVWGGGHVGLMGTLADAALARGGRAYGVIPEFMVGRELAHAAATELVVVSSMHERKAAMAARADAFVALPGGFGTLDELFEIVTWRQLGIHRKPIGLLNVGGFYDPLLKAIRHMGAQGFVRPSHLEMLRVGSTAAELLDTLQAEVPDGRPDAAPSP